MQYPVKSPEEWEEFERLSVAEQFHLFRVSARQRRRFLRRTPDPSSITIEPLRRLADAPKREDLILICVVRNAEASLPSFLAHYRRLGVARFAFVDDNSTDRTRHILFQADDVDLYGSSFGFRESDGGLVWRDLMVAAYGRDRWYVSVDADEYLLFPGCESRTLAAFIDDLRRQRRKRASATMLDLYPDGPLSEVKARMPAEAPPTEFTPLFDGDGYKVVKETFCWAIYGGPRSRLFGAETLVTKFPVVYVDRGTYFGGGTHHGVLPLGRNFIAVHCVLLHDKFANGAVALFREHAERGAHWQGAVSYKTVVASEAFGDHLDLRYPGSMRYRESEQLVMDGFMRDLRRQALPPASAPRADDSGARRAWPGRSPSH